MRATEVLKVKLNLVNVLFQDPTSFMHRCDKRTVVLTTRSEKLFAGTLLAHYSTKSKQDDPERARGDQVRVESSPRAHATVQKETQDV